MEDGELDTTFLDNWQPLMANFPKVLTSSVFDLKNIMYLRPNVSQNRYQIMPHAHTENVYGVPLLWVKFVNVIGKPHNLFRGNLYT